MSLRRKEYASPATVSPLRRNNAKNAPSGDACRPDHLSGQSGAPQDYICVDTTSAAIFT
jgi:hypothetical protein